MEAHGYRVREKKLALPEDTYGYNTYRLDQTPVTIVVVDCLRFYRPVKNSTLR